MKTAIVSALLGAGVLAAASANASVIFDQVNPSGGETVTVSFTATSAETTVAFFGFDQAFLLGEGSSDFADVAQISVSRNSGNGGGNLLGQTWSFTPARFGSTAFQFGTTLLEFGGGSAGSFDEFSQNVATVTGQTYDLDFQIISDNGGPSEVFATVSSVPEPATWTLALVGFGGLGAALRSRRRLALAA
jgi:hypothetical protein